jgi:hypothetical protein
VTAFGVRLPTGGDPHQKALGLQVGTKSRTLGAHGISLDVSAAPAHIGGQEKNLVLSHGRGLGGEV